MSHRAAITVLKPRDEVERLWGESEHRPEQADGEGASVSFKDAPGDRGTEIHVELSDSARGGKVGEIVGKVTGSDPLAEVKDGLRRFKAVVESGELPRSDGTPEGETAERKLKQRPAQPLDESEREKAGV